MGRALHGGLIPEIIDVSWRSIRNLIVGFCHDEKPLRFTVIALSPGAIGESRASCNSWMSGFWRRRLLRIGIEIWISADPELTGSGMWYLAESTDSNRFFPYHTQTASEARRAQNDTGAI